ncbi:hypothetical protein KAW80_03710 [Candidatus Babeliales bacterium]|nr:hypothetical protein [Candidatus Babeliales bacterium]
MIDTLSLRYIGAFTAVILASIGTGIGHGVAGIGSMKALSRQTLGGSQGFRAMILGLALSETGEILTLVLVILLLFSGPAPFLGGGFAELGIGIAMGLTSAFIGFASSMVVKSASIAIARQPFFSRKIITFMLLIQSIVEAPVIFAFLISLMIKAKVSETVSMYNGFMMLSAGIICGLGSIGPAIGQAIFASATCKAVGLNKRAYVKIFPFSLLSQAVIETPVIFSLLLAFALIYRAPSALPFMSIIAAISAVISMGIGSTGVGISIGRVAASACLEIAHNPDNYGKLFRTALASQALIESAVIYCLIIAIVLVNMF